MAERERRKRKRRKFSLGAVLGGVFGLLIAVSIGIVLSLSLVSNYTNTLGLLRTRTVTAVQLLDDNLSRDLAPAQDIVSFLARLYADGELDFQDSGRANAILRGASAGDPDVEAIILYRLDTGRRFGVFRGSDDRYGQIEDDAVTNPMIQRELMKGAPPDKAVWGKPVIVNGDLFANVRRSLVRDGVVEGYVVAAISIRRVSARLSMLSGADGATAFVIDSANRVLIHPLLTSETAIENTARDATGEAALNLLAPRLALFEDPVLRRFADREAIEAFAGPANKDVEVSIVKLPGGNDPQHNFIFMTRESSAFSARPWTLGLYYPAYAVNAEVRRFMSTMIAGLVLLAVSVLAAALLGRRMAKPFNRITNVANKVAALNFDDIDPLPASRIREFDDGSRTLNQMVEAISAFSTYVPKALVAKLIRRGAAESGRPAENRLTIMFTDIAGFTARSETMSAAETAEFLNRHYAILGAVVEGCGGTIDKYMGDGLLAFWGAPEPMADHAAHACEAALQIAASISKQNDQAEEGQAVRMRIGIHSGPTIVGNIGAASRINYTVVGDTVNICARLQEFGKVIDNEADMIILISGQTRLEAGVQNLSISAGRHHLRGREQEIEVYRLNPPSET